MRYDEWPKAFHSRYLRNLTTKTSLGAFNFFCLWSSQEPLSSELGRNFTRCISLRF